MDCPSSFLGKEFLDFVSRQSVVILQHHHLRQNQRPQVSARHFLRSLRSLHHLPTMPAPIPMPLKPRDLHPAGNDVFLNMLHRSNARSQTSPAVRTALQRLFHFPVNVIRLGAGAADMSGLAASLGRRFASPLGFVGKFVRESRNLFFEAIKLL